MREGGAKTATALRPGSFTGRALTGALLLLKLCSLSIRGFNIRILQAGQLCKATDHVTVMMRRKHTHPAHKGFLLNAYYACAYRFADNLWRRGWLVTNLREVVTSPFETRVKVDANLI